MTDRQAIAILDRRIRTLLPEEYQDTYQDVQPMAMGSAGLKYDIDGNVAWDEIWGSFCDLAMAGGPPHKGTLLEPGRRADIDAKPDRYAQVTAEICRGIRMATVLDAQPSPVPGWVRVASLNPGMGAWLLRAIVMENVAVRAEGHKIDLPAAPHFRLGKEIKNVITVIAKTSHYWTGHMPREQQRAIADLFVRIGEESPLIEPGFAAEPWPDSAGPALADRMAAAIERTTALQRSRHRYAGWLGLTTPSVRAAIWMMRALVVTNVLARREETVLFVPVNTTADSDGDRVVRTVARIHQLAVATGQI